MKIHADLRQGLSKKRPRGLMRDAIYGDPRGCRLTEIDKARYGKGTGQANKERKSDGQYQTEVFVKIDTYESDV